MAKKEAKVEKFEHVKHIETKIKLEVAEVLGDLINSGVSFRQILLQLGSYYMWGGSSALTGLPIITNEGSCRALENALVCKYVLNHWKEISDKSVRYFAKLQREKNENDT